MPLEDYTKVRKLGQGSFGSIYLVQDRLTRKPYVMKEVDLSNMNEKGRQEALKEAKFLSQLQHPNIISYREFFEKETSSGRHKSKRVLYIIMEYADGGDLSVRIKNQRGLFPESQIIEWLTQICLCLKHMHDRKILHRDIKSENVFLTKDNVVKLGDFGISKNLAHTFALAHTRIGTPYYLSPEICLNKPYDSKNDMWALGVVIYEAMSLKHPFDAESMEKLLDKIVRGRPAALPRSYSPQLRDVVEWLLKKDPRKRPSVHELLKLPFIKDEVGKFLDKDQQREEFSHTILHNYNNNRSAVKKPRYYGEDLDKELGMPAIQKQPSVPGAGLRRRDDRDDYDGGGGRRGRDLAGGRGRPRTPNRWGNQAPPSPAVGIKRVERDHYRGDRDHALRRPYPAAGPPPSGDLGMSINAAPWREERERLGSRRGRGGAAENAHHEVARREREDQLANIRNRYFKERKEARDRMGNGASPHLDRGAGRQYDGKYNGGNSVLNHDGGGGNNGGNPFPAQARPARRRQQHAEREAPSNYGGNRRDSMDEIMGGGGRGRASPRFGRRNRDRGH